QSPRAHSAVRCRDVDLQLAGIVVGLEADRRGLAIGTRDDGIVLGTVDEFAAGAAYWQSEDYRGAGDRPVIVILYQDDWIFGYALADAGGGTLACDDYDTEARGNELRGPGKTEPRQEQAYDEVTFHFATIRVADTAGCMCNLSAGRRRCSDGSGAG